MLSLVSGDIGIDEMKIELRRLPQKRLETFGIIQARDLHDNAIITLPLDHRLGGSQLVDPASNNFDRLLHRSREPRLHGFGRKRHA